MRKSNNTLSYLFSLSLLLLSFQASAAVFTTIADGNWNAGSTWNQSGAVPGSGDDVIINGYSVTMNISSGSTVNVHSISFTNTAAGLSELFIDGLVTLTVSENLTATSTGGGSGIELKLLNGAILNVDGNASFERAVGNSSESKLKLKLEDASRMNVSGTFTYDYHNADGDENWAEIDLINSAILDVTGDMNILHAGGAILTFRLSNTSQAILRSDFEVSSTGGGKTQMVTRDDAHFQVMGNTTLTKSGGTSTLFLHADGSSGKYTIDGNLSMNSTQANKVVYAEATNSNCIIDVRGNVSMNALSEGDVYIELKSNSNMYIGKNFLRPADFGALIMSSASTLTYNGTTAAQEIAATNLVDSGVDNFDLTNVVLNNSFGFQLEGTLTVSDNLNLTLGNIKSTLLKPIIVEEYATITGGSKNSYINGPVIKRGKSSGAFLFPIGDNDQYAPLGISQIANSSSEFMAQYASDPPPFGNLTQGIMQVSDKQHWELETLAGTEVPEITLHWTDPTFEGITDVTKLLVVGLDPGTNDWKNFGNSAAGGTITSNDPGYVTSNISAGDPPPFGTIKFTIGSDTPGSLPVELLRFEAVQDNDEVYLEWATVAEINSSHFVVERSLDGTTYEEIAQITSFGDSDHQNVYSTKDWSPYYGPNFYRLKIVDHDGFYEYSNIEIVRFEVAPVILIYPNPVRDILKFQGVDLVNDKANIEVFTTNGQLIYKGNIVFNNGSLMISTNDVNIRLIGTYLVRLTIGNKSHAIKLMKSE